MLQSFVLFTEDFHISNMPLNKCGYFCLSDEGSSILSRNRYQNKIVKDNKKRNHNNKLNGHLFRPKSAPNVLISEYSNKYYLHIQKNTMKKDTKIESSNELVTSNINKNNTNISNILKSYNNNMNNTLENDRINIQLHIKWDQNNIFYDDILSNNSNNNINNNISINKDNKRNTNKDNNKCNNNIDDTFSLAFIHDKWFINLLYKSGVEEKNYSIVQNLFYDFLTLDFDITRISEYTNKSIILLIAGTIFHIMQVDKTCGIDYDILYNFLYKVENKYHKEIYYHNADHAADVVYSLFYLFYKVNTINKHDTTTTNNHNHNNENYYVDLNYNNHKNDGILDYISDYYQFAALVAAVIHDIEHFGLTNSFLRKTKHTITTKYNGNAPLESMHSDVGNQLLTTPEFNIFSHLPIQFQKELRNVITKCVLGTDMCKQKIIMASLDNIRYNNNKYYENKYNRSSLRLSTLTEGKLKVDDITDISDNSFEKNDNYNNNHVIFLRVMLHAADLGHSTKPFNIHQIWAKRLHQEFSVQNELNINFGFLPTSCSCNKNETDPIDGMDNCICFYSGQAKFIKVEVLPIYEQLRKFISFDTLNPILNNLLNNIEQWNHKYETNK